MKDDIGPQKLSLFIQKINTEPKIKPPAHEWQDFALQIIAEFNVPNFKRNSVFKICKDNSKEFVLKAVNETRELCKSGEKWKYFFKVIASLAKPKNDQP